MLDRAVGTDEPQGNAHGFSPEEDERDRTAAASRSPRFQAEIGTARLGVCLSHGEYTDTY
jgi:hypothetical protein